MYSRSLGAAALSSHHSVRLSVLLLLPKSLQPGRLHVSASVAGPCMAAAVRLRLPPAEFVPAEALPRLARPGSFESLILPCTLQQPPYYIVPRQDANVPICDYAVTAVGERLRAGPSWCRCSKVSGPQRASFVSITSVGVKHQCLRSIETPSLLIATLDQAPQGTLIISLPQE
jgi:hypothetical protein